MTISLMALTAAAKVASDVAVVKCLVMGISSAIAVYAATKPRAYHHQRRTKEAR